MNPDKLYDFQQSGVEWLSSKRDNGFGFVADPYVGLIGDEMGLGKTAQGLATLRPLIEAGKRILFIVPGATMIQWQKQYEKWINDLEIDDFGMNSLQAIKGSKSIILKDCSCIMSHSLLASHTLVERLVAANFDGILIDEIHKFGAEGTKRIKHLWALINLTPSHFVDARIALSGTPVRNYAKEIYNTAHFLDPIRFRVREDFARKYLTLDGKALYNPRQFHSDFAPYYIRRTVSEVQKSLPSIRRTKLYTTITNTKIANMYNRQLDLMDNFMNSGSAVGSFSLLGYLQKLRHITGLAKAGEAAILEPILEYVRPNYEDDSDLDGRKAVLGIHHHLVATRLQNSILGECKCGLLRMAHYDLDDDFKESSKIAKNGCVKWEPKIQFFMIRGGMDNYEKENTKADFIAHRGPGILLLSIKAAGEGIDGLQFASSKAYVFERQWNGADELQFEKRIHRTGQTEKCSIEYTIAEGTVDEFFDELIDQKRQFTTQVEDEHWETNPAFLKKLAEKVVSSRISVPSKNDLDEFERIIQPKADIRENIENYQEL